MTPHVAQNINAHRGPNIDGRTTRHAGLPGQPRSVRKRIEEANGWIKQIGGLAQTKLRGVARVEWMFVFKAAADNLIRLPRLTGDRMSLSGFRPRPHQRPWGSRENRWR